MLHLLLLGVLSSFHQDASAIRVTVRLITNKREHDHPLSR